MNLGARMPAPVQARDGRLAFVLLSRILTDAPQAMGDIVLALRDAGEASDYARVKAALEALAGEDAVATIEIRRERHYLRVPVAAADPALRAAAARVLEAGLAYSVSEVRRNLALASAPPLDQVRDVLEWLVLVHRAERVSGSPARYALVAAREVAS